MLYFWKVQPTYVRCILLVQLAVTVIAVVRSLKLAWRLYRRWNVPIVLEDAVATVLPNLIARSALANRVRIGRADGKRGNSECAAAAAGKDAVLFGLRMAEAEFSHDWEECWTDLGSIKRASVVTLLLTFVMITGGASTIFAESWQCYSCTGLTALHATVDQILGLLAFGLSVCTALYVVHGFFERLLTDRKARWTYFCAHLMNKLSRD